MMGTSQRGMRVRRIGWLVVVGTLLVNGSLVAALAFINDSFQDRADELLSRPVEIYMAPPEIAPPPPEPLEEEIVEPTPTEVQPMQTMAVSMTLPPRIQLDLDMPSLDGIQLEVADVDDQAIESLGTMELPDVDRPPQRKSGVLPPYPQWARLKNLEGKVTVEFVVGPEGAVSDVRIRRVEGDERFSQGVTECVRRWRFHPAQYQGRAVAVRCVKKLRFRLQ